MWIEPSWDLDLSLRASEFKLTYYPVVPPYDRSIALACTMRTLRGRAAGGLTCGAAVATRRRIRFG